MAVSTITGDDRNEYLERIWELYCNTYAVVGAQYKNLNSFLQDVTTIEIEIQDGLLIAFQGYKSTKHGFKAIASGHNGTVSGKKAVIQFLVSLNRIGFYGELSDTPLQVAIKYQIKVIPFDWARIILKKDITKVDEFSYSRPITGLNQVKVKRMFGRPLI